MVIKQINNPIKYCIDCNCELIIGTNWTEYRKNKYQYMCNKCEYKRTRERQIKNPTKMKANIKKQGIKVRKRRKELLDRLKINGCAICGYYNRDNINDYIGALDFHHVNPVDKEFTMCAYNMELSNNRIVSEINKCILLCCRCHREIEYKT